MLDDGEDLSSILIWKNAGDLSQNLALCLTGLDGEFNARGFTQPLNRLDRAKHAVLVNGIEMLNQCDSLQARISRIMILSANYSLRQSMN